MRPALARVPGRGASRCRRATRARSRWSLDPGAAARGRADRRATSPTRSKAQNQLAPVGPFTESGLQHLVTGLRPVDARSTRSPRRRSSSRTAPCSACRTSPTVVPGSPDRTALITGNGKRRGQHQRLAADRRQHPRHRSAGVEQTLAELDARAAAGLHDHEGLRPRRVRRDAVASVRDAILIGGVLAVVVLLVFLRDWRLTLVAAITLPLAVVADVRRSCGSSASRST